MSKKSMTLHGPAFVALLRAQEGLPALDDAERALRIATVVHMHMLKPEDMRLAVAIIQCVARDGLARAADVCTVRRKAAPTGSGG